VCVCVCACVPRFTMVRGFYVRVCVVFVISFILHAWETMTPSQHYHIEPRISKPTSREKEAKETKQQQKINNNNKMLSTLLNIYFSFTFPLLRAIYNYITYLSSFILHYNSFLCAFHGSSPSNPRISSISLSLNTTPSPPSLPSFLGNNRANSSICST